MATGVVAIACEREGLEGLAKALSSVNVVIFAAMAIMTLLRAILFPQAFGHDLADHNRGVGFFTEVAGTAVFASSLAAIFNLYRLPLIFWFLAAALWLFFTYAIFAAFILGQDKPPLNHGIHGGWLLAVVATESVAQLALLLQPKLPASDRQPVLFLALVLWLCGGMLYIWMISLIFYRYAFFVILPPDLKPFYWIDMGAMAIACVVGTLLVQRAGDSPLAGLDPFIRGFTVLFWATATWWIPMLMVFAIWRHAVARQSFEYSPFYWGAVFPLGMYAVATSNLSVIMPFGFFHRISMAFTWAALAAWTATLIGLLRSLARQVPYLPQAPVN